MHQPPPADPRTLLQHDHIVIAQRPRRREPRDATTDHDHVDHVGNLAHRRRVARQGVERIRGADPSNPEEMRIGQTVSSPLAFEGSDPLNRIGHVPISNAARQPRPLANDVASIRRSRFPLVRWCAGALVRGESGEPVGVVLA